MEPLVDPGMTPGQRIALYRRRRGGLTQAAAAQVVGVSLPTWRKWESDERMPNFRTWINIARVLGVRDLWQLTGLPVGDLPDEPAEHESVPAIRAALTAFPPGPGAAVEVDALHTLVTVAWNHWHGSPLRYSQTGPLLPPMLQALRSAAAVATAEQRPRVLCTTVAAYALVRAYCKRLGVHDLAMVAADRAVATAREADNPLFVGASVWNLATTLSAQGHAEPSAQLCRDAIGMLATVRGSEERSALTGSLHLLLAVQYARLDEQRRALDALDVADGLAGLVGETNHYRQVFGPANCGIHRAAVELELSHPGQALRIAERIDVTGMPSVERRHTHCVDLAVAFCAKRNDVAAVHVLERAWRESPEESRLHPGYRASVRELLRRETPTTRPVLRPLAEQAGIT